MSISVIRGGRIHFNGVYNIPGDLENYRFELMILQDDVKKYTEEQ